MTARPSRVIADTHIPEEQYDAKRARALKALEALDNSRRYALLQLQKTHILFKYLNWKQQESINTYGGGSFSVQKMRALSANPRVDVELTESVVTRIPAEKTASYVQRAKTLRKTMLQFDMVEARAGELTAAIVKAAAAFNHHYKSVYRELFPLGIVSKARRSIRRFFDHPYYDWREVSCLGGLGAAAGFVLKMAEAPVVGARR
jgi:hypothetical protein